MTLKTNAYAKINLILDVTGKREDGYHEITGIMQQVSLCDVITVTKDETADGEKNISLTCSRADVPLNEKNIAYRCAAAFFDYFSIESYKVSIDIEKNIPMAAGMAGGSTDGAAVLKLLNEMYGVNADTDTLCSIGAKLGADIPFCIRGGCCITEGIGEKLTPLKRGFDCRVLCAIGNAAVSTPQAYGMIDRKFSLKFPTHEMYDYSFVSEKRIPADLYNVFESVILETSPVTAEIKQTMKDCGAVVSLMSGSGPSVFGLFDSEDSYEKACEKLTDMGVKIYKCGFID